MTDKPDYYILPTGAPVTWGDLPDPMVMVLNDPAARLVNTTPLGLRATLERMLEQYRALGKCPGAKTGWLLLTMHATEVEALIAQLSDQLRCERKASGRWWNCHFCQSTWQIDSEHARLEPNWRPPECPDRGAVEEEADAVK